MDQISLETGELLTKGTTLLPLQQVVWSRFPAHNFVPTIGKPITFKLNGQRIRLTALDDGAVRITGIAPAWTRVVQGLTEVDVVGGRIYFRRRLNTPSSYSDIQVIRQLFPKTGRTVELFRNTIATDRASVPDIRFLGIRDGWLYYEHAWKLKRVRFPL